MGSLTVKKKIEAETAPRAIGPYSQAIEAAGLIFCSGQIPLDPASGQVLKEGIREQTERVLQNLHEVLTRAGSSLEKVLKTTVYLKDLSDFTEMNEVYGQFFSEPFPARSTVEVARLPRDVRVEIDVIALA
jgi:2-iminobutanoate/2-iminopropanoate deaminase